MTNRRPYNLMIVSENKFGYISVSSDTMYKGSVQFNKSMSKMMQYV